MGDVLTCVTGCVVPVRIDGLEILLREQHKNRIQQRYLGDIQWAILQNVHAGFSGKTVTAQTYTEFCESLENADKPKPSVDQQKEIAANDVVDLFNKYQD